MIDGVISGRLLLKPKTMLTGRGTPYLIAKMTVYGYQSGNVKAESVHGDLIVFDAVARAALANREAGEMVTVCGVIVPVREVYQGIEETVFKVTVSGVLRGYISGQTKGKGAVFDLMARAGWLQAV